LQKNGFDMLAHDLRERDALREASKRFIDSDSFLRTANVRKILIEDFFESF
jgi:hypothetical protein